jgi:hypothetical protein
MSEASSLNSVVRVQTWLKIDDDVPLAMFHEKFWGKSMKDEEAEWCRGYTERGFRDEGGKRMELDEDERLDVDDDMIPGCYVLDVGVDGLGMSSLWICANYHYDLRFTGCDA